MLPVMSLMTAKEGELILCHVFNIWNSFKKSGKTLGKTIVVKLLCNRIGQHQ